MIVRTKKNRNYTTINNTVLEDERLSWRAKGIAAYLLSKPDDWQISHEHLLRSGKEGRDAVLNAMKELEDCGYLVRTKVQGKDGKFSTIVTLLEVPQPTTENQDSVISNRVLENRVLENRQSVNQDSLVSTDYQILKPNTTDDDDNARTRARGKVFDAWAENFPGTMVPLLAERINDLIDECGEPSVIYGIDAAVQASVRNFNYVAQCARNHASGAEPPSHRGSASGQKPVRQRKTGYSDHGDEPRKKYSVEILTGGRA